LEHEIADPVGTGRGRILITGAAGQLGRALQETFAGDDVVAPPRARRVTARCPAAAA